MTKIALALGGNRGDVAAAFDFAAERLRRGGVTAIRRTENFVTAPEGCAPGTPDFCNSALTGEWAGSAEALLELTQSIERAAGRPARHGVNRDRVLDLDIILFGEHQGTLPGLILPHPRAAGRRFVLEPLARLAADWPWPGGGTVRTRLEELTKLKTTLK